MIQEHLYEYWDRLKAGKKISEHGITFERLNNNDGRYTINTMVDGKRVHRVLGKESESVTRQQAEECITKLRTDARHGRLNLPRGRKLTLSFKKAAAAYLEKLEQEGGKNIEKKENDSDFISSHFLKTDP